MARLSLFPAVFGIMVLCLFPAEASPQEASRAPADVLKLLKEGNERFATGQPMKMDTSGARRKELAKEQHPRAVILACADSRVAPELIFDQGLGELFVLRVAGNVTDPDVLGSIEFALASLKAPLVVIVGHDACGAVKAALTKAPVKGNLGELIARVHVGKNKETGGDLSLSKAIRRNVLFQVEELGRKSAVIKEFIDTERVRLAAGVYSLETGRVEWLDLGRRDSTRPGR